MRTTLNLDDDVVASLKSLSLQRDVSMGEFASELIRQALAAPKPKLRARNGIRPFTPRAGVTTRGSAELVRRLLEDEA